MAEPPVKLRGGAGQAGVYSHILQWSPFAFTPELRKPRRIRTATDEAEQAARIGRDKTLSQAVVTI